MYGYIYICHILELNNILSEGKTSCLFLNIHCKVCSSKAINLLNWLNLLILIRETLEKIRFILASIQNNTFLTNYVKVYFEDSTWESSKVHESDAKIMEWEWVKPINKGTMYYHHALSKCQSSHKGRMGKSSMDFLLEQCSIKF